MGNQVTTNFVIEGETKNVKALYGAFLSEMEHNGFLIRICQALDLDVQEYGVVIRLYAPLYGKEKSSFSFVVDSDYGGCPALMKEIEEVYDVKVYFLIVAPEADLCCTNDVESVHFNIKYVLDLYDYGKVVCHNLCDVKDSINLRLNLSLATDYDVLNFTKQLEKCSLHEVDFCELEDLL